MWLFDRSHNSLGLRRVDLVGVHGLLHSVMRRLVRNLVRGLQDGLTKLKVPHRD